VRSCRYSTIRLRKFLAAATARFSIPEVEIGIPGAQAGRTDDIHDTVHYGQVVERFTAELAEHRFGLLEALAEHLAGIVTGEFRAPWVRLSVTKLGHIRNVRKVGVTIERSRGHAP
jgi:dihydroneopterin aldolase